MQTYRLKKQRDRNGFYQMIDETDRMFALLKKKKNKTQDIINMIPSGKTQAR